MSLKPTQTRIDHRFRELKNQGRSGLITFVTAGDPDLETSYKTLIGLPNSGADFIEIGMPFSDPMADGPSIQLSSQRALKNGINLKKILKMVDDFRKIDDKTPIILMGYYNPIYHYGPEAFLSDAKFAGVDGIIVVDLPPEEEKELCIPAINTGINFVYLTAPTTDDGRLQTILEKASGFIYFVSILGITGTKTANFELVRANVNRIKSQTKIPIGVGFGIRTPEQVSEMAEIADAVIVGSALVDAVQKSLDKNGCATNDTVESVLNLVSTLADGLRENRVRTSS